MHGSKGAILMTVIVVLIFLSVMGMSLLGMLFARSTVSMLEIDRLKSFYLAEAGIAKSVYELRHNIDYSGDGIGNVSRTKLGEGEFWAAHNFITSTITATGEVNKVKRTIQIKYSVY
jgi:Tfp pilus assembly protein PilX